MTHKKLLIVGGGSDLQPRLRQTSAAVRTAVLCRASVLPWVHRLDENRAVVVLNDECTVDEWVTAARTLREVWPFEGVVSFAEIDQDRAAAVAHALGLPFHSPLTVRCSHDKLAMREWLREVGVEDLPHRQVGSAHELQEFLDEVGPPLIVKPQRGRSSAGVAVIRSSEDVAPGFERATGALAPRLTPSPVLAERFVEGPEFSVEALSHGGRHYIFAITGKRSDPVSKVELGHVVPAAIDRDSELAVLHHVRKVLTAIGVESGITHTEVIASETGPVVVETHLRLAGDEIPLLVEDATGVNMTDLLLRQIAGEDISATPELRARAVAPQYRAVAGIRYLAPLGDGSLAGVDGWDDVERLDGVCSVDRDVKVGAHMAGLESSYSRLGHVRVRGADSESVERSLDTAIALLTVRGE